MATTQMQSSPIPPSQAGINNNNKRKRGPDDIGRNTKMQATNGDTTHDATNYAALLQGIDASAMSAAHDDNTRTAQAALATPMNQSTYPEPASFEGTPTMPTGFDTSLQAGQPSNMGPGDQSLYDSRQGGNKPAVGTSEWHQLRKDNHKEGMEVFFFLRFRANGS